MAINNINDQMLTVREVSIMLHVHPNTLRRWADKGVIKSFCITPRGDRRFMARDVDKFLAEMNSQNQGLKTDIDRQSLSSGSSELHRFSA
jgi:excisionase family DNA binding protein